MTFEELFIKEYEELKNENKELNREIECNHLYIKSLENKLKQDQEKVEEINNLARKILKIDTTGDINCICLNPHYIWEKYDKKLFDMVLNKFKLEELGE